MDKAIKEYLLPGKKNIILIYITYLAGMVTMFSPIIGACYAYKNRDHKDGFLRGHYEFAFKTFWVGVAVLIAVSCMSGLSLGFMLLFDSEILVFISGVVAFIAYPSTLVWVIVRSIIAIQYLIEDKDHPNPLTFWIK